MAHKLTAAKARTILRDNEVNGHPLSAKQRRYMGYVAGGGNPNTKRRKAKGRG